MGNANFSQWLTDNHTDFSYYLVYAGFRQGAYDFALNKKNHKIDKLARKLLMKQKFKTAKNKAINTIGA